MNACYLADLFNRFMNRFIISRFRIGRFMSWTGNPGYKIGDRDRG